MKAGQLVAIGGVGLIGACGGLDSKALFGDVGGSATSATSAGAGGNAGSAPQNQPVAAAGTMSSTAGTSPDVPSDSPTMGGESGEAGGPGEGGEQATGAGGTVAGTSCAETCVNGSCTTTNGVVECECRSGYVVDGLSCRRPKSCNELFRADPGLADGAYTLQPLVAKDPFQSYCLMSAEGGGWTLVLNHGTEFEPSAMGSGTELGYADKGTNLAYSGVVLESDVMLDVRMDAIASETYTARAIIRGVHADSREHTVRELFTSGPHYLEAEDNSNLTLASSRQCNFSPVELGPLFCESPVIVFGNQESNCRPAVPRFAISGAESYTRPWNNCAGWPQATVVNGQQHFPNSFRVWIR